MIRPPARSTRTDTLLPYTTLLRSVGVAVALGSGQVADHVLEDFVRCFETERRRVADVQLEDAMAYLFQAFGVLEHGTADVVTDIGKLVRFADLHDPECPEDRKSTRLNSSH